MIFFQYSRDRITLLAISYWIFGQMYFSNFIYHDLDQDCIQTTAPGPNRVREPKRSSAIADSEKNADGQVMLKADQNGNHSAVLVAAQVRPPDGSQVVLVRKAIGKTHRLAVRDSQGQTCHADSGIGIRGDISIT